MTKIIYELIENTMERKGFKYLRGCRVSLKKDEVYTQGITMEQNWQEPYTIATFENKNEALEALKNYKTEVRKMAHIIFIKEYYVQKIEINKNNENDFNILDICEFASVQYFGFNQ